MGKILVLESGASEIGPVLAALDEAHEITTTGQWSALDGRFDLCLVEGPCNEELLGRVAQRKRREVSSLLPFLLLTEAGLEELESGVLTAPFDDYIPLGAPAGEVREKVLYWLALRSFSQQWYVKNRGFRSGLKRARLRGILNGISDGVIATDREGRIEMMNPEAERLTGCREGEAVGKLLEEVFRIVNEETRQPVSNPVRRVIQEGTIVGLANHTVLISQSGAEYSIADSGSPVFGADGEITGAVLIFRDQTHEHEIRRITEQARAFAESIVETLHEPLLVLDAELRVVAANQAFYRLFRVAPEETVGVPVYLLGNGQWDIPELRELLEHILPENHSFKDYEVTHEFPSLGRRTMLLNARALSRGEKKMNRILLAVEDVTERLEAERILIERENHLQTVLETAPVGIYLLDAEGRILQINRWGRKLLGLSLEAGFTERNFLEFLSVPDRLEMKKALEGVFRGGLSTLEIETTGGEQRRQLQVSMSALSADSVARKACVCIAVDLTNEKKIREHLTRTNRTLTILSDINQIIVRGHEPHELMQQVCKVAVEEGGFRLAWVGKVTTSTGKVEVAAFAGGPVTYLEDLRTNLADSELSCGPVGACIRSGNPVVVNDIAGDPRMLPWREATLKAGFHSMISLPIRVSGEVGSALSLYADKPGFFDGDEVALLRELSSDLGFALEAVEQARRRTEAENSLRESEERFRTLAELSLVGIYLMRADRFFYVNQAMADMFGYPRKEFLGRLHPLDVVAPEDRERVRENMRRRLVGEVRSVRYTFLGLRRDGSVFHVEAHGTSLDWRGEPAILGTLLDVTDRVKAEEDLRRSREMLRIVLDTIPIRVFWKDRESVYLGCNRSFAQDAGLQSPDEVVGKTDFDMDWRLEAEAYRSDDRKVMDSGLPLLAYEETQRTSSGLVRWLRTSKVPLLDTDGNVSGVLGTYEDITEQKRAAEALRESEERFRVVTENSPIAVMLYQDHGWVYANPAAQEVTGYSFEELRGRRFLDLVHPEDLSKAEDVVLRRRGGDKNLLRYELRILTKQGEKRTVSVSSVAVHWRGLEAELVTGVDISERKRLEEQLVQAQKMEAVGQLAGGIAHDFNNMLSIILGYVELARMKISPDDSLSKDLEEIWRAARRSADLTRQLLGFARRQIISPRPVDLNHVVAESVKILLRRLIPEDIAIEVIPGENLWTVNLDPTQIDQILTNLATNARDAIEGVGRITIETRNTVLDRSFAAKHMGAKPGEYVELVFSDTGCGMDSETLSRLFEPFFTTKEPGKGTGLGLSTVYGVVKQNDGYIEVSSELGRGTVFHVYFPRWREEAGESFDAAPASDSAQKGSETILVVEDEKQILDVCRSMLEGQGYRVLTAESPGEALEKVSNLKGTLDLVATDVIMPGMNGRELVEKIRQLRPQVRVLFMSGYTSDAVAHRGILDGEVEFISKPFSLKEFVQKVREVLNRPTDF